MKIKKKDCIKKDILHQKNNPDDQQLRRMRQKEESLAVWGGRGFKMATQAILPPTPVAALGLEPASFQEIWRILKTRRRVLVTKSAGGK